jgi:hypothetical protein
MDITNIKSQAILNHFFGTLTPDTKEVIAVQNTLYNKGEESIAMSIEHAIQFIEEDQPEELTFFKTELKTSDEWLYWSIEEKENIGNWKLLFTDSISKNGFYEFIAVNSDYGAVFGHLNGEIYSTSNEAMKNFFESYVPVQVDWDRD